MVDRYVAAPVALVTCFMLQSLYSPGTPGLWKIMVLLPAVMGTSILFAPSWIAVAAGVFLRQALRQRASSMMV